MSGNSGTYPFSKFYLLAYLAHENQPSEQTQAWKVPKIVNI